uniref:non-specific serine/threonine protein kinase n=1 Tax=Fagus sylvatica TaxID=28930 RepID=A0A2N9F0Q2_FAGSY
MTAIGRTHHRNLVQLLGFCIEGSRKLLVYEYMSNGSLADLLFKAKERPLWKERVRIALEVARGVFYLHQECQVHVIHCNLKLQNILMDDTWTAKISDFGSARLSVPNQTRNISMGIEGTSGYSAPEWQKNALISVKSDIYSYGVMLLEIVCCRSNIEVNVLRQKYTFDPQASHRNTAKPPPSRLSRHHQGRATTIKVEPPPSRSSHHYQELINNQAKQKRKKKIPAALCFSAHWQITAITTHPRLQQATQPNSQATAPHPNSTPSRRRAQRRWVYNCLVSGELDKLVEDENVDMKTLERMVKVGLWCIQEDPALRPPMKNVILMLEGTMDIAAPPSPAISHS